MNDWTAHTKGTCDICGPFRVRTTNVTVRQRLDDGTWSYRVRCPSCEGCVVATLRPRVALQLLLAQAPIETWSLPADEREGGGALPPVTLAHLVALRADLDRDDVVDALRATLDAVEP